MAKDLYKKKKMKKRANAVMRLSEKSPQPRGETRVAGTDIAR